MYGIAKLKRCASACAPIFAVAVAMLPKATAAAAILAPVVALTDNYFFVGEPYAFDLPSPAEWFVVLFGGAYLCERVAWTFGWYRVPIRAVAPLVPPAAESDLTDRLIGPLLFDVDSLVESAERVKVQVYAMAEYKAAA